MTCSKLIPVVIAAVACVSLPATASAQRRGGGGVVRGGGVRGGGGHAVVGRAIGRPIGGRAVVVRPRIISPRIIGVAPYRPYYYGYRPGLTIGFFTGFGYRYPYYGYRYPYYYGGYPGYGYGYPVYGYSGYGYPGYGYPPAPYVSAPPGYSYGGVHIEGAPPDAQVLADGYYVGVVDDFDGPFQHLNLTSGPHRIEIRMPGDAQPIAFDVNVPPGQTITLRVQ
jgi:hypothetical protein